MTIDIQRFESAAELRDVAEPFLMRNEAQHNVLLGLVSTLETAPGIYGRAAPYLAAVVKDGDVVAASVMTPPRNLLLSLCDDADVFEPLARDVAWFRRETAGVNAPVPASLRFAETWQRLTGDWFDVRLSERLYTAQRVVPPASVAGGARHATDTDVPLLTGWLMAFNAEALPYEIAPREVIEATVRGRLDIATDRGGFLVWEAAGQPVCVAGYGGPTPNSLRIGPVYTPPEHRQRGYGSACTAAAAQYILDSGRRFASLYTDTTNATTNHIYQAIGFEPVCDAVYYGFQRSG